jgi:hypothetical protein
MICLIFVPRQIAYFPLADLLDFVRSGFASQQINTRFPRLRRPPAGAFASLR